MPQNKELMRVFRDLDLVEQLGSGIPKILQTYTSAIYHFSPNFIRVTFPFAEGYQAGMQVNLQVSPQATMQATMQATPQVEKVLKYCVEPRSRAEIQAHLGLKNRDYFRKNILLPLVESGQLRLTLPDKPTSPKQKFVTVQK